ncbi:MAG: hypothetical protein ACI8P2_002036 [Candidatus Latescibacterota bacterium]|jgi:hypothetical protein
MGPTPGTPGGALSKNPEFFGTEAGATLAAQAIMNVLGPNQSTVAGTFDGFWVLFKYEASGSIGTTKGLLGDRGK